MSKDDFKLENFYGIQFEVDEIVLVYIGIVLLIRKRKESKKYQSSRFNLERNCSISSNSEILCQYFIVQRKDDFSILVPVLDYSFKYVSTKSWVFDLEKENICKSEMGKYSLNKKETDSLFKFVQDNDLKLCEKQ